MLFGVLVVFCFDVVVLIMVLVVSFAGLGLLLVILCFDVVEVYLVDFLFIWLRFVYLVDAGVFDC